MAQPFVEPCDRGIIAAEPCPRALGREIATLRRDFASERTWAWFGRNNAAVAWLDEGLCHGDAWVPRARKAQQCGDIAGPYPEFMTTASLSPHRRDGILRRGREPEANNKHASIGGGFMPLPRRISHA